jgi:hypothetical protein
LPTNSEQFSKEIDKPRNIEAQTNMTNLELPLLKSTIEIGSDSESVDNKTTTDRAFDRNAGEH